MQPYWLQRLKPNFKILSLQERLLCGLGALLGLAISSLICWYALGGIDAWYIAPMGASAVLLFAVSSSPLAQPWNILLGNTIASLVGVSCALWIPDITWAFSFAAGLSIFLMLSTDSLHPPSGAIALTAVLGGDAIHAMGYSFVFYPVLLNSILLLAVAMFFNQLIGRQYPQPSQINQRAINPTPTQKVTIQPKDIEYALEQHTELLDISQYDLQSLILQAQQHAHQSIQIDMQCADIMTKNVVSIYADDEIVAVIDQFKTMNIMSLPVLDEHQNLVGTLALSDIVSWFQKTADMRGQIQHKVKQIMHRQVVMVRPTQNIADLIPYFVEKSFNYLPVVENGKLLGMISRADMIAMLYQNLLNTHQV